MMMTKHTAAIFADHVVVMNVVMLAFYCFKEVSLSVTKADSFLTQSKEKDRHNAHKSFY